MMIQAGLIVLVKKLLQEDSLSGWICGAIVGGLSLITVMIIRKYVW